jgi:identified by metaGeneAnnotator
MLDKIKMNNKNFRLTREDNGEDIGFAISCMYSQAITLDEFKSWIDYVILNSKLEDLPSYIWEIVDWDGKYNIYEYIGFTPYGIEGRLSDALTGIAIKRNMDIFEPVSKKKALDALRKNPNLVKKFKDFFPFIKFHL